MYDYSVEWRCLDPETEKFASNNAREAVGLFLSRHGGCGEGNYGRTLKVKCSNTGAETFWACIRLGYNDGMLFQTDERGDVINDVARINEILRRHNLPEIQVVDVDLDQPILNGNRMRWAERVTVKAVIDDSTCEVCRGLDGRRLGDVLRLGYSGPPFHDEDDDRGPCRCSTWGPSPLQTLYGLAMRVSFDDEENVPLDSEAITG